MFDKSSRFYMLIHRIQSLNPMNDLRLSVLFQNDVEKEYDIHNLYSALIGIYQADISEIERGLANPLLSTLKRLVEGMGAKLKYEFILKMLFCNDEEKLSGGTKSGKC